MTQILKKHQNFKIHGRTVEIKQTKIIYFHCGTDLPVWSYALAYGSYFWDTLLLAAIFVKLDIKR